MKIYQYWIYSFIVTSPIFEYPHRPYLTYKDCLYGSMCVWGLVYHNFKFMFVYTLWALEWKNWMGKWKELFCYPASMYRERTEKRKTSSSPKYQTVGYVRTTNIYMKLPTKLKKWNTKYNVEVQRERRKTLKHKTIKHNKKDLFIRFSFLGFRGGCAVRYRKGIHNRFLFLVIR